MAWWNKQKKSEPDASICFGARSDVGRIREENEDAFGHFPEQASDDEADRLFIVADGMGGHSRGREASTTAVEVVQQTYFDTPDRPVTERLTEAFQRANTQVYQMAREDGKVDTMGTTGTALALVDGQAYIAHVGDSRAYRISDEDCEQLTHDHTMVEEMRREGLITKQEARSHPRRGALTRAIGTEPDVRVDVIEAGMLRVGDRFLLCSDGLADIPEEEVRDVVLGYPPQEACEQLVQRANKRGGYDNATALVIYISDAKC